MEDSTKKMMRDYGVFLGLIAAVFLIVIGFSLLAHLYWEKGLQKQVQNVLEENLPGKYTVGDSVPVDSPLTVSTALFRLESSEKGSNGKNARFYAVITRVETFCGPFPGVFIYEAESRTCTFAGFANMHGRMSRQYENKRTDVKLQYWKNRIAETVSKAEKAGL